MKTILQNFYRFAFAATVFIFSGCSKEKQITGSVVLTELQGLDATNLMIGVRSIPKGHFDDMVKDYLKTTLGAGADQELITNLEIQVEQLRNSQTNISRINDILLECRSRRHELDIVVSQAVDQFLRAAPPMVLKSSIDKPFQINTSGRDWLLIQLFRKKNTEVEIRHKPFELWMVKASDCRDTLVVGEESVIDSLSRASQVISEMDGKIHKSEPSANLVSWAASARIQATKAKEIWESEFRIKNWEDGLIRLKSRRLRSGDRYTLPHQTPEISVRAISGGNFIMGSPLDEAQRNSDENQHKVAIENDYFILETECTQKMWQAVMTNNPSFFKSELNPVEQVSWDDALRYCSTLTTLHRKAGIIGGDLEWRLPSEAEWEFSCRAGQSREGIESIRSSAVFAGNSGQKAHHVATKQPNSWGLYDMRGNVWEWCSDWYNPYPASDSIKPLGNQASMGRVLRGGGWILGSEFCRAASRRVSAPNLRYSYVGFRPVLSIKR